MPGFLTSTGPHPVPPRPGQHVDSHVHVAASPLAFPPAPSGRMASPSPLTASVARLLDTMHDAGVGQAVLVQPAASGLDHSYLLDCLTAHPGRFAGTALVSPRHPDSLDRLMAMPGADRITAIRLVPLAAADVDWFGPGTEPILRIAANHRLAVSLLLGPALLPAADAWIQRHPDVAVIVDHLARPDLAGQSPAYPAALLRLARHPGVHVKVSALPQLSTQPPQYHDLAGLARCVLAEFGPERLMWGSDFPFVGHAGYRRSLEALDLILPDLPSATRTQLLGSIARRMFRLPELATTAAETSNT